MTSHFELLTRTFLQEFFFRLTNSTLQNIKFHFELLTRRLNFYFSTFEHGTIIRTGITCKKTLVICATQLAGGLLLKKLKYFEVMLNIFELSRV